jgi:hypothetical protein
MRTASLLASFLSLVLPAARLKIVGRKITASTVAPAGKPSGWD